MQELKSEQCACDPVGNVLAEIADAPVRNITDRLLDVAADENISNKANNEDNHDVVGAPAGNVADIAEVAAVENIGNQVNQDDNHDVVDSPVIGSIPDIADINHRLLDGAAVETITGVREHEYEQAPDITHFNCLLQSISQQLWLQDNKINELEARINHLQDW